MVHLDCSELGGCMPWYIWYDILFGLQHVMASNFQETRRNASSGRIAAEGRRAAT